MAENSHSGFNAPRAHLARHVSAGRTSLFAESVGPLGNPARTLEAVRSGSVDVVALDGFYVDLLRHHDPERLSGLRVLASTPWTPIPLLVAAPGIEASVIARLRECLLALHTRPRYAPLLAETLLARFVAPEPSAYGETERMRERAEGAGYATIR
jgi:ABC-type phosphate/phosphonate transport system substrate-binding protein